MQHATACIFAALAIANGTSSLKAAETQTFTLDALGRLTKVVRTGSINDGVDTSYKIDTAGNRQTLIVTGSQGRMPVWVIVLPMGEYFVLPLVDPLFN